MKEFVNNKFVIPAEAGIHSFVTTSLDSLCTLPLRNLSLRKQESIPLLKLFWIPDAVYPYKIRGGNDKCEAF